MKEFVEKLISKLMKDNRIGRKSFETIIEDINQLAEEYNNGWIPVSERLPEENIIVDVTIKEIDGDIYTEISWLHDGKWIIRKTPLEPKVIAWKKRPQPYIERK